MQRPLLAQILTSFGSTCTSHVLRLPLRVSACHRFSLSEVRQGRSLVAAPRLSHSSSAPTAIRAKICMAVSAAVFVGEPNFGCARCILSSTGQTDDGRLGTFAQRGLADSTTLISSISEALPSSSGKHLHDRKSVRPQRTSCRLETVVGQSGGLSAGCLAAIGLSLGRPVGRTRRGSTCPSHVRPSDTWAGGELGRSSCRASVGGGGRCLAPAGDCTRHARVLSGLVVVLPGVGGHPSFELAPAVRSGMAGVPTAVVEAAPARRSFSGSMRVERAPVIVTNPSGQKARSPRLVAWRTPTRISFECHTSGTSSISSHSLPLHLVYSQSYPGIVRAAQM